MAAAAAMDAVVAHAAYSPRPPYACERMSAAGKVLTIITRCISTRVLCWCVCVGSVVWYAYLQRKTQLVHNPPASPPRLCVRVCGIATQSSQRAVD